MAKTTNDKPNQLILDEEEATEASSIHGGRKRGGWITFPFITVAILALQVGSSGWSANLTVFLIGQFNFMSIKAAQVGNIVSGTSSFLPIFGAILADSFFGNFSVIAVSSLFSLMGLILFMFTVTVPSLRPQQCAANATGSSAGMCEAASTLQLAVLYTSITLSALGLGGSRFTVATMGADQFEKPKDQECFFNWHFFNFYVGLIIGVVGIVYIQDNIGWDWGVGLCLAVNILGLITFLVGKRYYRQVKTQGNPYKSLARVVVATILKRNVSISSASETFYHGFSDGVSVKSFSSPTSSFRFLNRAALKVDGDTNEDGSIAKEWRLCTVQQVEDFKTVIRIIPLWFSSFFLSTQIGIQSSLAVLQALRMDRHIGTHNFKIPAGSFLVFTLVATAISLTLIDRFLVPTYQKFIRRPLTPLQRIGVGHVLTVVSMAASAIVERKRLSIVWSDQLTSSTTAVTMSALWLVIPLTLVGVGDAFHFPGQVALYYQEFPVSLHSTSTAMISLLVAVGFYLSTAMIDLVQRITGWLPNNINQGRLDNMFWLLVVIGVINFGYFIVCSLLYKYQNVHDQNSTKVDDKPRQGQN
ncbi:hypothetical protein MKW92_043045 [Papaver armeniacum]|nr:hypothetical protein MKW92_043045 [Papaver armeniacum]